jgi:hypothetical protein
MILDIEETFVVGEDTYFQSSSIKGNHAVFFEDDEQTGYFYAAETEPSFQVLDALHIYNVIDVIDKAKPSKAQICWTDDGLKAALLINNYCHAAFDFSRKAGYSRNGFPKLIGHKSRKEYLRMKL